MRDKERIESTLKTIESIWNKYPDLRLGQLILNVCSDPVLYYIEDDKLIQELKDYYTNTNITEKEEFWEKSIDWEINK